MDLGESDSHMSHNSFFQDKKKKNPTTEDESFLYDDAITEQSFDLFAVNGGVLDRSIVINQNPKFQFEEDYMSDRNHSRIMSRVDDVTIKNINVAELDQSNHTDRSIVVTQDNQLLSRPTAFELKRSRHGSTALSIYSKREKSGSVISDEKQPEIEQMFLQANNLVPWK